MNMVIKVAMPGAYENKPPYEDISPLRVLRATTITTAKTPRFVAAYTMRYVTTARNADSATPVSPATASGIRIKPPCAIDEYANIRMMLVCFNAMTLPSVIVAAERIQKTGCHTACEPGNPTYTTVTSATKPAAFEATDKNAVTGVGAP